MWDVEKLMILINVEKKKESEIYLWYIRQTIRVWISVIWYQLPIIHFVPINLAQRNGNNNFIPVFEVDLKNSGQKHIESQKMEIDSISFKRVS